MNWIIEHSWTAPLIITVLSIGLFVYFLATVKGDNIMAGPSLMVFCILLIVIAWSAWAIVKFIRWLV